MASPLRPLAGPAIATPTSRPPHLPYRLASSRQLRDLPKLLLSGAEADWRGQLRALRHAEHLIRAAPDELSQYAGRWPPGLGWAGLVWAGWAAIRSDACLGVSLPFAHWPPEASLLLARAVPIARALVHTKVPGWMDEEMPQQPPSGSGGAPAAGPPLTANMQRFRCGGAPASCALPGSAWLICSWLAAKAGVAAALVCL